MIQRFQSQSLKFIITLELKQLVDSLTHKNYCHFCGMFQEKIPNFSAFGSSSRHHRTNIFVFWTVDRTKQAI